jgi:hypothetical protein
MIDVSLCNIGSRMNWLKEELGITNTKQVSAVVTEAVLLELKSKDSSPKQFFSLMSLIFFFIDYLMKTYLFGFHFVKSICVLY